jgi:hypothetical protein
MSHNSLPLSEVNRRYGIVMQGLRLNIPTYEILRRYESHYDRLNPYLTHEQRFNMESQFSRHEYHLNERTGLGLRPSESEMKRQAGESRNKAHSRPVKASDVDKDDIGEPTAAGDTRRKRKRTPSEENLAALETIDWDDFGPSGPPSPPPPPPPIAI